MRTFLITICISLVHLCLYSQNLSPDIRENEVFLELGGHGLGVSINYDRQLTNKPGIGFRLGVGLYGRERGLTIPFGLNYLFPFFKTRSYWDLGAGLTYAKADVHIATVDYNDGVIPKQEDWCFVPSIGLRSISSKNYVFRGQITPGFTFDGDSIFFLGLGFGKRF